MQYLAVTLLIAGIAASVVTTGVGEHVTAGIGNAICRVTAEDCKTAAAPRAAVPKPPEVASPKPDEGAGSGLGAAWNRPYRRSYPTKDAAETVDQKDRDSIFEDTVGPLSVHRAEREWMRSQGFSVVLREGGGSAFDLAGKVVYIDTTTSSFDQEDVWELAVKAAAGVTDPTPVHPEGFSSREEFIKAQRDYNTERDYRASRLNRMIRSYYSDYDEENYLPTLLSWKNPDLYNRRVLYDWGYENAVAKAERSQVVSRPLSEAEKQRIGERGGRAALYEHHKRRDDIAGSTWDSYHPSERGWRCLKLWHCA